MQISAPPSSTKEIDNLISLHINSLETHPTDFRRRKSPASRALSDKHRAMLETRRAQLRLSLTPANEEALEDAIAVIFGRPTQFGISEEEAYLKMKLYSEVLRGFPAWAMNEVQYRFGSGPWQCQWKGIGLPESHHIAAECRHILLPIERELARLNTLLDAEVYEDRATPDERERAVAHARTVISNMRSQSLANDSESTRNRIGNADRGFESNNYDSILQERIDNEHKSSWIHVSATGSIKTSE